MLRRLVPAFVLLLAASYGLLRILSRTTLEVDGKTFTHYSLQKITPRELLQLYQVQLSSQDLVRPAADQKIWWGEKVQVIRVREKSEEKKEVVNFILSWKKRTSKNLRKVEVQEGYRKETIWQIRQILHNGKVVETKKIRKKTIKTPVKRLVLLNKKGRAQKIYDLSRAKKMTLIATAYWEGDPQVPGVVTFSGHRVERGLVAVDPQVLPLGWRLYIPGYGYAYSSDTGLAIKGNRIDLFVESKEESRKWEYVKVDVYLLEKAKKW